MFPHVFEEQLLIDFIERKLLTEEYAKIETFFEDVKRKTLLTHTPRAKRILKALNKEVVVRTYDLPDGTKHVLEYKYEQKKEPKSNGYIESEQESIQEDEIEQVIIAAPYEPDEDLVAEVAPNEPDEDIDTVPEDVIDVSDVMTEETNYSEGFEPEPDEPDMEDLYSYNN